MKQHSIVIVENDEDEQDFLREGFEKSELFKVITVVSSAPSLYKHLDNNKSVLPDIILTDLNMEGRDGYDVLRFISSHPEYSSIPVVVYSGSLIDSIIQKCMSLGASHVILKPSTLEEYINFPDQLYQVFSGK
jgi:CheY-like chemotaxis protein